MLNIDKYLSVIWRMGGRCYPFLDCYGIVHEIRRDLNLPEWPAFEGIIQEDSQMDLAARELMLSVEQCKASHGVVAACYKSGMVTHVGIVVEIDGLLHVIESNPKTNVTILPIGRFERRYAKVEYYQ